MCLFSRLFQNIRYRHVFSLQSRETTVFTPSFPLLVNEFHYRNRFKVTITHCVILVTRTGSILLANRNPQGAGTNRCAHVSVKSKEMQLASIRPWIDGHSGIWCLLCHINGGWRRHIWWWDRGESQLRGRSYREFSCGDTFSRDTNTHGNRFNIFFTTGIHNLLHEFWEPWPNRAILEPVVYGTVL